MNQNIITISSSNSGTNLAKFLYLKKILIFSSNNNILHYSGHKCTYE